METAETSTSSRSTAKRLDIAGARRAQTLGQQVRHAERHFQNTSLWPADFASPYQFGEPFRVATFTCGRRATSPRPSGVCGAAALRLLTPIGFSAAPVASGASRIGAAPCFRRLAVASSLHSNRTHHLRSRVLQSYSLIAVCHEQELP